MNGTKVQNPCVIIDNDECYIPTTLIKNSFQMANFLEVRVMKHFSQDFKVCRNKVSI